MANQEAAVCASDLQQAAHLGLPNSHNNNNNNNIGGGSRLQKSCYSDTAVAPLKGFIDPSEFAIIEGWENLHVGMRMRKRQLSLRPQPLCRCGSHSFT